MQTIRALQPSDIDQYLEVYLNAYPAFKSMDSACRDYQRARNLTNMELPDVEYVGLFEGASLLASMKLVHFQVNLYGTMTPALGLMSLAVHPLHKKKGLALKMVQYYEHRAVELGMPVAPLLPFNIPFYRKMGYGLGSKRALYQIPTANLPAYESSRELRFLGAQDFDDMIACYNKAAAATHGMIERTCEEIGDLREDDVTIRLGAFADGVMTGYLAYRFEDASETNYTQNRIDVQDLVYLDEQTLCSLLGYLRKQADLAQTVKISSGEEDFYHLLSDPQDVSMDYLPFGYLQVSREYVGFMYKIVDYPLFFELTKDRPAGQEAVSARFVYTDAFEKKEKYLDIRVGGAAGGWQLLAQGEAESLGDAALGSTQTEVTLTCSECDLCAVLMNAARLAPLVRMGLVKADDEAAARRLDAALYYDQKPYSNTDF